MIGAVSTSLPKLTKHSRKPFSHALLRAATRERCEACHAAPAGELHRALRVWPGSICNVLSCAALVYPPEALAGIAGKRDFVVGPGIDDAVSFVDEAGISRCRLVLEPKLVATEWQPKRAFQGWRYYDPKDVPADLSEGDGGDELPPALRAELAELGLR